ncbi:hypothetical protein RBA41_31365 [Massilia sp. CCM 9210]|uniref:hypothetical protein n=1 Tax=Massilia scottii TaxID=3057166 RepID=UPI002796CF38|nr:hypothetical protein [Massilia sp. CCM 9210]MDQ1817810.1 hypothetical protein [Massilia sp. CCM 9210]
MSNEVDDDNIFVWLVILIIATVFSLIGLNFSLEKESEENWKKEQASLAGTSTLKDLAFSCTKARVTFPLSEVQKMTVGDARNHRDKCDSIVAQQVDAEERAKTIEALTRK